MRSITDPWLLTAGTGLFCASSLENLGKASQLSTERLHISLRGPFTFLTPLTVDVFALIALSDKPGKLGGAECSWFHVDCWRFEQTFTSSWELGDTASILSFHICLQSCKCQSLSSAPQTKRVSKSANVAQHTLMWCMLSYCTSFTSLSDGSVRNRARPGAEMP